MKIKNNKIILGILVVGVIVILASTARGSFLDIADSQGNSISSGEFDIRIGKDNNRFYETLKLFELKDMKPGDVEDVSFYIKNYGNVEVSNISIVLYIVDREDELSPAEKPFDLTDDVGELSKCITATIIANGSEIVKSKLNKLAGKDILIFSGKLKEKEVLPVKFRFKFDGDSGNECMTDSVEVRIKVIGSQ
ncbi:methyltransferase [Pyrococcus furiosus DSM 3638]|uniref:Methyltransferase n=3 Tax=Pyrococcus furiosus TaxID=2261 RepID=Q8U3Q5_PYRFU|nr:MULTISPECIES: methyltransferase [Pyrococcus]AAL80525.1 methyltransferase [Pyrococcus furiosus DSM 3638]AFN03191.1 methyltransferase [Pyrococcus furiosus COM1]MDK2869267.1 hypothetical protein [Pyrococcus sp.]QEK78117.1 methyltransferase [Pyrococcus furiosus DSM 3638]